MKYILIQYIVAIFLIILIFGVYIYENEYNINSKVEITQYFKMNSKYCWPAIGYNRITSDFGYRQAPTSGASTYHSGIDIAVPAGSNLVSSINGEVIYTGFKGAGGHTIIISNGDVEIAYCHVDSKYYPKVGAKIKMGQVLGKVGPKYIDDVDNNKYRDASGKTTNGATTGPHLHFSIKINGEYVNPLIYIEV